MKQRPSDVINRHKYLQLWDLRLLPYLPEEVLSVPKRRKL